MQDTLVQAFTPHAVVSTPRRWTLALCLFGGWMVFWWLARPAIFPSPAEVVAAVPDLWANDGLGQELASSLTLNFQALALAVLVSLPLAYLSCVPAIDPIAWMTAEFRIVSPAVFFLPLLFVARDGHELKVLMLALGETCWLVTTVRGIVQSVPVALLDDCRTLRMNEWQVTWYAIVRGTLDRVVDAIRDNAAMGWSMVMMVEGFVRSEGGIGVLALNQQKHMNIAAADAIVFVILGVGALQDFAFRYGKRTLLPWTDR